MYHKFRGVRVAAAVAIGAVCWLACPPGASAQSKASINCQGAIVKSAGKYEQKISKALQKCEDSKLKGKLAAGTDCIAATAGDRSSEAAKFNSSVDKKCGGLTPTDIQWGSVCPDFDSLGCEGIAITDISSIKTCALCLADARVNQFNTLTFGNMTPTDDKDLQKCQREIGKDAAKLFQTRSKAVSSCQGKALKGAVGGPCPEGKAHAKIDKTATKGEAKIASRCGAFSLAQIGGATACPAVTSPGPGTTCGGSISTTDEWTSCLTCVAEGDTLCPDCSHCGNGVTDPVTGNPVVDFDLGETCDDGNIIDNDGCPENCLVRSCVGFSGGTQMVDVSFSGANVAGLTVYLRYAENAARIPGRANEASVQARVTGLPGSAFSTVNDLDYALRVAVVNTSALAAGKLFTVEFDTCKKPKFKSTELDCIVEDASSPSFEPVAGVTCSAAFVK